jgi:hypothetical protein
MSAPLSVLHRPAGPHDNVLPPPTRFAALHPPLKSAHGAELHLFYSRTREAAFGHRQTMTDDRNGDEEEGLDTELDPELDPENEPFFYHLSRLIGQVIIVVMLMLALVLIRRGH